jgi:hypothetical protein
MATSGIRVIAGLALLTAGCTALPWIERENRDSPAMAIAHQCETEVAGTRVTGADGYGRPIFTYRWENERGFFEQCFRDKRQAALQAHPELKPETLPMPAPQLVKP